MIHVTSRRVVVRTKISIGRCVTKTIDKWKRFSPITRYSYIKLVDGKWQFPFLSHNITVKYRHEFGTSTSTSASARTVRVKGLYDCKNPTNSNNSALSKPYSQLVFQFSFVAQSIEPLLLRNKVQTNRAAILKFSTANSIRLSIRKLNFGRNEITSTGLRLLRVLRVYCTDRMIRAHTRIRVPTSM